MKGNNEALDVELILDSKVTIPYKSGRFLI